MRKRDFCGFLEILDHLKKVSDHQSGQVERQNVDFPYKSYIYERNQHFASLPNQFNSPKLYPDGPRSLENHRNRVFASSRYGLNKILSKTIKFRESYSLLEKGNLRDQKSRISCI